MSLVKRIWRRRLTVCVMVLGGFVFATVRPALSADKAAIDGHLDAVRHYQRGQSRAALFAVEEAIRASQGEPELRSYIAGRLVEMLAEDATPDGKLFVCRQLWYLSSAGVPAKMLGDESTADMACYAILGDRSPEAGRAILDALGRLEGVQLVRLINLMGERRDKAVAGALAEATQSRDEAVVRAAAAALGKIGGAEAVATLHAVRRRSAGLRAEVADALLQCAEGFAAEGDNAQAAAIYRVLSRDEDRLLRRAGLQGLSRTAPDEAVPLVVAALRSKDRMMQRTVVGCIRTMEGDRIGKAFAGELPKLDAEGQVILLAALADNGGAGVLNAIRWAAGSADAQVKTAALAAIAKAGDASFVDMLVGEFGRTEFAGAAASALRAIRGGEVEAAIVRRMQGAPAGLKVQLINVLFERNAEAAAGALLAEAGAADGDVRRAALHALGRLAGPEDLPALLERLTGLPDDGGRREAERAVIMVAQKIGDSERRADAVVASLAAAEGTAARCSLLRVLGQIGNDAALAAVMGLMEDNDAAVRDAAVRALTAQSSTRALDAMAKVFAGADSETHRILALRGYVRLLQRDTDLTDRAKAVQYERAMAAAASADEKRLIIGGLSAVRHSMAIELVRRYVEDAAVQAEAKLAIAKIEEALRRPPQGFVAIFDGKTFAGWEGNLDAFRIEDGSIVGGTLNAAIPRNEFLCTEKEYADFELRLKVRLLGDAAHANAGIQIRSRRVPNHHEMSGYQADMGQHYWGCLYDESRRNRVLAQADRAKLDEVLVQGGWNDYVIRCEGKRIRLWINDLQTVDYVEPEDGIEQTGLIGLQIHSGPPTEAWYKDIYLRSIDGD